GGASSCGSSSRRPQLAFLRAMRSVLDPRSRRGTMSGRGGNMPHYSPADDGKCIDGKTIIFLYPPGGAVAGDAGAPRAAPQVAAASAPAARVRLTQAENVAAGKDQAVSLATAARNRVPLCQRCEKARPPPAALPLPRG